MNYQETPKIGNWLFYLVAILLFITVSGLVAYFTNGFTSDFKTFYLEVNGDTILDSKNDYKISDTEPMTVKVHYAFDAFATEANEYYVKVIPNIIADKDFDFTLDGNVYSFQSEKDLTSGFEILKEETSFTIKPKGNINDIIQAVYPTYEIGDCRGHGYDNMFTLVVTSYNGKSSVKINFSIIEKIESIVLDKEEVIF